jgi:excisionase family DNA binding protein
MVPKLLLPIPDVAEALGIGRSKAWELIASGELSTVRIGRRRLVPIAALERYVTGLVEGNEQNA